MGGKGREEEVWARVKGEGEGRLGPWALGAAWALGPRGAFPPLGPLMAGHMDVPACARGPHSKVLPKF